MTSQHISLAAVKIKMSDSFRTLSLDEAATFLKLSPSALRQKAKEGKLPGAKIGKRWVFIEKDLAKAIRSSYRTPRQALQVTTMKKSLCHYTNVTKSGGFGLPHQTERKYDALLKRS